VEIDLNDVIQKFQEIYPREFSHVVSEVRADSLQKQLDEANAKLAERGEDPEVKEDGS